jgi:hypothetical protein
MTTLCYFCCIVCKAFGHTRLDRGAEAPQNLNCAFVNAGGWATRPDKRLLLGQTFRGELHTGAPLHIMACAEVHADTDIQKRDSSQEVNPQGRSYYTHHLSVHVGPELAGVPVHVHSYADGRAMRVDLDVGGRARSYCFLYAPGCNRDRRRQTFFHEISRIFPGPSRDLVVAGDFNCIDCMDRDKTGGRQQGVTGGTREWTGIRRSLGIHDEWRRRNPDAKIMSWVRNGQTTSTRIDRVEMSERAAAETTDVEYVTLGCRGVDHRMVRWKQALCEAEPPSPVRRMVPGVALLGAGGQCLGSTDGRHRPQ